MYSDYEGRYYTQQGEIKDDPAGVVCFGHEGFVYEVIRVLDRRALLFRSHLDRLKRSIELMGWPDLERVEELYDQLKSVIALNEIINQNIKIRVDLHHGSLFIMIYPVHSRYPSNELYQTGVVTGLYDLERHDPNAKAIDHNMLSVREALHNSGLHELLLVNHEGAITEGSKSNVIFIKDRVLYSAPEKTILLGITRSVLKHAVQDTSFQWRETSVLREDLEKFEGAFLTGTSIHLLPIHSVDNITYQTEKSPVFAELNQLFLNQIYREHEEDY